MQVDRIDEIEVLAAGMTGPTPDSPLMQFWLLLNA
jgi:hypothetical protein